MIGLTCVVAGFVAGYNIHASEQSDLAKVIAALPEGEWEIVQTSGEIYDSGSTVLPTESASKTVDASDSSTGIGGSAVDAVKGDQGIETKGGAKIGETTYGYMQSTAKAGSSIILFAGIAFVVAGVLVFALLQNVKLGLILAGAGGIFIAIGIYPWLLLVGMAVVALLIGYLVYAAWKSGRIQETLKLVVAGIESAPPKASVPVKASIAKVANGKKPLVKAEVSAIKAKS